MLKKIPHEVPVKFAIQKIADTATTIKKRAISKAKEIQRSIAQQISEKDDQIIVRACLRLSHFIEKQREYTYKEIDELIDRMHRMILSLQRKKEALMRQHGMRKENGKRG